MGFPKDSAHTAQRRARFEKPTSIFDLANFCVSEFIGVSGALVTRICEGEFGVTREAWQLLAMLVHLGEMSPSALAAATTIDQSQLSKSLKVLCDKELVYRKVVSTDRRRAMVGATPAGHDLYHRIFPRVMKVHDKVLEGFSEADKVQLSGYLHAMHRNASNAFDSMLQGSVANRRRPASTRRPPPLATP